MPDIKLIQLINKQLDTPFPAETSVDDLQHELSIFINELIIKDFPKLINILYKIDVDEQKLKTILRTNPKKMLQ